MAIMSFWFGWTIVLVSLNFEAIVSVTAKRTPLLLFDFRETKCHKNTCPNLGFLADSRLSRNASIATFLPGKVGVESSDTDNGSDVVDDNYAVFGSTQALVTHKQQNGRDSKPGLSISLWIRTLEEGTGLKPIFTVGAKELEEVEYSFTECDDRQIDLQLQLFNRSLIMVFRTSDTFFEPCQKLKVKNITVFPGALTHVAMVLKNQHQQVYVNGESAKAMQEPFDSNMAQWNRGGIWGLFSYHGQPRWHGQVYRLEVVEGDWDEGDVKEVMARGVAPALPVIYNVTHRIYEDAEILPGSHATEWYRNPISYKHTMNNVTQKVPIINLSISFLDEEVSNFLESRGISYNRAPTVGIYILATRGKGDLYYVGGQKISTASNFTHLSERQLVYIPEHNAHSQLPGATLTTIEYCVALREVFVRSHCAATAFINIIVDPVNDPPVAFVAKLEPYTAHEGICEELVPIWLRGSDIDQGDAITLFEIVTPPRLGYLYLSVPVRRHDNLYHGTLLSDLQYLIPGSDAYVEYRYTGTDMIQDDVVIDSFDFRVRDSQGSWSIPNTTKIQIVSSLKEIVPSTSDRAQEDAFSTLVFEGRDDSGLNRSFGFLVDSLPPAEDALPYSLNGQPLQVGDIIPQQQGVAEIGLLVLSGRLCDDTQAANTTLEFRVAAYDDSGLISSVSDKIERNVTVECRVTPIGLVVPQETLRVKVATELWNDRCGGYMYNRSRNRDLQECQSAILVDNIRILSDASHSLRALVVISSTHGLLTLNPENRHIVRFLEDQPMMRSSIRFTAIPSQIDTILAGLHFQSRIVGVDEIRISIEYGDCQARNYTCFRVTQSIPVNVLPATTMKRAMLFGSFPWIQLPFTLTLLLLMKFKGKLRVLLAVHRTKYPSPEEATMTVADTTSIRWQQFYDDSSGFHYYLNLDDGTLTWDVPLDEPFLPCESSRISL